MRIEGRNKTFQRQQQNYQKRLRQSYLSEKKFLEGLQKNPELLPRKLFPDKSLSFWQQCLLLSSACSLITMPAAATPFHSPYFSRSNRRAREQFIAHKATTVESLRREHDVSQHTVERDHRFSHQSIASVPIARMSLSSNFNVGIRDINAIKANTPCMTVFDCFSEFLREAGRDTQEVFTHLLDSSNIATYSFSRQMSQFNKLTARLQKTFPQLTHSLSESLIEAELHAAYHIRRSQYRRHLPDISLTPIDSAKNHPSIQLENTCIANTNATEVIDAATRIEEWADPQRFSNKIIMTPVNAIGVVLHHYDDYLSERFLKSLDLCLLDELEWQYIDEAALLYKSVQQHGNGNVAREMATAVAFKLSPTELLSNFTDSELIATRTEFAKDLVLSLKKEALLTKLFLPHINGVDTKIYFDGIALRGAFGKTIEELVNQDEVLRIPDFKNNSPEVRREILQEKLARLGENLDYPFGTVANSLASTIQRIFSYQQKEVSVNLQEKENLFKIFHQLEMQWETQRQYPIHPRLLFATHLAHASNVEMKDADWQEQLWHNKVMPNLIAFSDELKPYSAQQATRSLTWLASYLAYWNDAGQPWSARGADVKREALHSLYNHFREISQAYYPGISASQIKSYLQMQKYLGAITLEQYKTVLERLVSLRADQVSAFKHLVRKNQWQRLRDNFLHDIVAIQKYYELNKLERIQHQQAALLAAIETGRLPTLPEGSPPNFIIWLAKETTENELMHEVVAGDEWRTRIVGLMKYAADRLIANYELAPQFNRAQAAYEILRQHDLSPETIEQRHSYTLPTENHHILKTSYGSYIDEFLERADWNSMLGKTMFVRNEHTYHLVKIEPESALQAAEEQWNSDIVQHPWVQARARENCRFAENILSQAAVMSEAQRIGRNYRTETEAQRQLAVGLETWINTVPVIGPIYNIEEGIRHKDPLQIVGGSIFFALDAIDLLAGEPKANKLSAAVDAELERTALRIPANEHTTAQLTHVIAQEIDIPLSDFTSVSADFSRLHINPDPWQVSVLDNNIPKLDRAYAVRVRAGEADVLWMAPTGEQYPLVRIANEDRIVPIKHNGASYQEISWDTGLPISKSRVIYYDTRAKIYITAGLQGGGRVNRNTFVGEQRLRNRYTVSSLQDILKVAIEATPKALIEGFFTRRFPVTQKGVISSFATYSFYAEIYKKSATFRRIANHFLDSDIDQWQIIVCEKVRPYTALLDIERVGVKNIYIPDDNHIRELLYLGVNGWHPFTHEQIYLDGILPAMTGKPDMITPISLTERGPNIALRDRILFEAGRNLPQQISYSRVTRTEHDLGKYDVLSPNPESRIEEAIEATIKENLYFDPIFDDKLILTAEFELLGENLADRFTVTETKRVSKSKKLTVLEHRESDVFEEEFKSSFDVDAKTYRFYRSIYGKSSIFRRYWGLACDDNQVGIGIREKWQFITDESIVTNDVPVGKKHSAVNMATKKAYIFPDNVFYLSSEGLTPVESQRKLIHQMLQILTGAYEPTVNIWTNRGVVVYLTERILKEAGYRFPTRLAYGLTTEKELQSGQFRGNIDPRVYQITAQRVQVIEDRYLKMGSSRSSLALESLRSLIPSPT